MDVADRVTSVTEPPTDADDTGSQNELRSALTTSPELHDIEPTDAPACAADSINDGVMTDADIATISCQTNCSDHVTCQQSDTVNDAMTCETTQCESASIETDVLLRQPSSVMDTEELKCESVKCESAGVEMDMLLHQPSSVAVRLFKRRWLMIFLFACYSMSNAYQWIHLNIIFDKVCSASNCCCDILVMFFHGIESSSRPPAKKTHGGYQSSPC